MSWQEGGCCPPSTHPGCGRGQGLFTVREIQTVVSCLFSRQNEFHRHFVFMKIIFAVQKSFSLKDSWCKSTGFNMFLPSLRQSWSSVGMVFAL